MINRSIYVASVTGTVGNTVLTLATFGFDAAAVAAADKIIISVTANALRLTYDTADNAPTNSAGLKIPTNNYPFWVIEGRINAGRLRMIRNSSADATVTIVIESS